MKLTGYKDLVAWRKAIDLVDAIYNATDVFPQYEQYSLAQQLRRAAVSIPSNLAEGSVRGSKEFAHFISIARGSLAEVETQMIIAQRRDYIKADASAVIFQGTEELSRILMGLLKSIKSPTN